MSDAPDTQTLKHIHAARSMTGLPFPRSHHEGVVGDKKKGDGGGEEPMSHHAHVVGAKLLTKVGTLGELIEQQSARLANKRWMTYVHEGQTTDFSYGQFFTEVCKTANFMQRDLGLGVGDRICVLAYNHPLTVQVYFAAWLMGACVVPVNATEDDERIEYIQENSEAKAMFIMPDQLARYAPLRDKLMSHHVGVVGDSGPSHHVGVVGDSGPSHHVGVVGDSGASDKEGGVGDGSEEGAGESDPMSHHAHVVGPKIEHFVQMMGDPDASYIQLRRETTKHQSTFKRPDYGPETESLIVYTSGTTGAPKGVVLEQYNLLADAHSIAEWHAMTEGQRMMCVLPIHHVNGIIVTICTPLYYGGSVVLNRRFSATSFWQILAQQRVNVVSVVPTILAFLCEKGEDISKLDFGHFRHFICGAGPLTVELGQRFEETFGMTIQHGYGLSETTCYDCFLPIGQSPEEHKHWMRDFGFPSIGCPISCNEMAIHDDNGKALPPGQRGEIVARGPCVMKHYFRRPDANKDTFKHGWFRSGDEGFWEEGSDGLPYYFITGRLKELIIRGGVNYSPLEIDEAINAVSGVKAGMAVGFENDMYGEEIGAYVVLEEGASLTEAAILAAMKAALPWNKRPKVVVFGTEFPVTSTGKYQRNKLKPQFEQWKHVQFQKEA